MLRPPFVPPPTPPTPALAFWATGELTFEMHIAWADGDPKVQAGTAQVAEAKLAY